MKAIFSTATTAFSSPLLSPAPPLVLFSPPCPRLLPISLPVLRLPRSSPTPKPASLRLRSMESSYAAAAVEKPEVLVFDAEEELAASLAKHTSDLSGEFARRRSAFTVVLSGGSLVKALRKLTEGPYKEAVDWGKWHVFWVDERVVPKDHPDSNYKLAYDGFLSKVPIPLEQVYVIDDTLSAEGAADAYEARLKQLVNAKVLDASETDGFPVFDLMLLGMGPDGHVASLFPGHPLLNEKQRWVTYIKDSPKPPPERITFTFPVINLSSNIVLVATGSGKADAVRRALGDEEQSLDLLPVQMVSPKKGKFTWFTDKGAVSKL